MAYLYRIFDYYDWCDLIVTHLSVRVPGEEALFIIPFGVSFDEVTPDNLVKVDFEGNILERKLALKLIETAPQRIERFIKIIQILIVFYTPIHLTVLPLLI